MGRPGPQTGRLREGGCTCRTPGASAEPDGQCRRPLRRAAAVLFARTASTRTRRSTTSAASRARRATTSATCSSPASCPARRRRSSSLKRGHEALQHRLQQHRAERRLCVDAGAREGFLGALMGAERLRHPRRLHALVQPRRPERLHGDLRRQPRHPHRRRTATKQRQPRRRPLLLRDTARLGSRLPGNAGLSDDRRHHAGRQRVRSGHRGAERRLVLDRAPAQRRRKTWRSKCATSAPRARLVAHVRDGNNGNCTGRHAELQRVQHLREQVHRRVPAGAAQPAREHRGGRQATVRLHRRARAPRRCRRSSRSSTPRTPATPATRRSTPAPTGRARRSSTSWRRATRIRSASRRPAPTGLMGNATLRANAAAAGVPANYFVANPDLLGGALPAHQHRQVEVQLDAGRAAPPLSPTACCSRPATCLATATSRLGRRGAEGSSSGVRDAGYARRRDALDQGQHRL